MELEEEARKEMDRIDKIMKNKWQILKLMGW